MRTASRSISLRARTLAGAPACSRVTGVRGRAPRVAKCRGLSRFFRFCGTNPNGTLDLRGTGASPVFVVRYLHGRGLPLRGRWPHATNEPNRTHAKPRFQSANKVFINLIDVPVTKRTHRAEKIIARSREFSDLLDKSGFPVRNAGSIGGQLRAKPPQLLAVSGVAITQPFAAAIACPHLYSRRHR
jgi:hypothetical protein